MLTISRFNLIHFMSINLNQVVVVRATELSYNEIDICMLWCCCLSRTQKKTHTHTNISRYVFLFVLLVIWFSIFGDYFLIYCFWVFRSVSLLATAVFVQNMLQVEIRKIIENQKKSHCYFLLMQTVLFSLWIQQQQQQ